MSQVAEPSIADVFSLLQSTLKELADAKQSLASLQESMTRNHHKVIQDIEKLRNTTKKHYTKFTSLPMEVVGNIMAWIHPQQVWKLRALSTSFKTLLSSSGFVSLNVARCVPSFNPSTYDCEEYSTWDVVFFAAPTLYQSEYARKVVSNYSAIEWKVPFHSCIPKVWLPHLKSLTWLDLTDCALTGNIPNEIEYLVNLECLDLEKNLLTGEIPPSIGKVKNMRYLRLCNNDLMGPIPSEIVNLRSLEVLSLTLARNPLVPTYLLPELGSLSRLQNLDLSSCHLVGTVPKELCQLEALVLLHLHENELEGPVPMALNLLNLHTCDLVGNPKLQFPFDVPEHWYTDIVH
ncbi:L domain-like protein [Rhizoclosmatium globosum]|uniref:L domain-like protein n=1 Tax=Rhizoclosmatium globosum TaxID=329046 RepID=A0A1Y2CD21_9FUNG|nr:L domain-like protein [Rhizoclosmatium globosum]|eukprot:ORY44932.1 L domain-like protein [Rhizoclosmatium globosum]